MALRFSFDLGPRWGLSAVSHSAGDPGVIAGWASQASVVSAESASLESRHVCFVGRAVARLTARSCMIAACALGAVLACAACGSETTRPDAAKRLPFPIDLQQSCPAGGCSFSLDKLPYDGVL